MLASKKEEKLSRTQELNTAKIQALRLSKTSLAFRSSILV